MRWCIMFLLLVAGGCQGGNVPSPELFDKDWTLVELGGEPVSVEKPPSIRFSEPNEVTGFSGCNRLSGSYERTDGAFRFGPIITTKMACPDVMELEHDFVVALESTRRVEVTGSSLELIGDTGALAKLSAE